MVMPHPFVDFLIEREVIPANVAKRLSERQVIREPIGMIAASHGILNALQIDKILDRQRGGKDRFGEIAVNLGFLTHEQVQILIKIQEFRTSSEIAEALALSGVLSVEDAGRYLGAYLMRDREVLAMMSE
jgi:hypothetical protein